MCEDQILRKIGRGLYTLYDQNYDTFSSYAQATKIVPKGVICLLSALRFHALTTQAPNKVWIAIDNRARTPVVNQSPVKIIKYGNLVYTNGIETHTISGIEVSVYSVAKTICDCFKYKNKIGIDVALEALREGLKQKSFTSNDIWKYAEICNVSKIIMPYMEAMRIS
jgi:predicted transcriptional regulator of viral defense system